MSMNDRVEPDPEELNAVNGSGFWNEVMDFGKGLWKKTKDVVIRLKNWG